jgi:hypothetical protein
MYSHGFLRVASCVPRGRVADPTLRRVRIWSWRRRGMRVMWV